MAPDTVPTGTTLAGRYVVGALLGEGGFGAVYEATQVNLGRRVAIKVLRSERILQSSGLERFAREARAAAALGHPHIAQVTDFQTNPGEPPFFVMEHLVGRTLGAALAAEGTLPADRICTIAQQVLSALEATHAIGIVHRDVKPDNVFLVTMPGVREFVKLLDFGIAKLAGEGEAALTSVGAVLGTPAFMAPEQIGNFVIDARTDIYAVGATMYYAMTGRKPHSAPTLTALLYAIAHEVPATLESLAPHIDRTLAAVVGRAMHKDPAGRFASAREMRAALEPWAARLSLPMSTVQTSSTLEVAHSRPPTFGAAPTNGPTLADTPSVAPTLGAGPAFGPTLGATPSVAPTLGAGVALAATVGPTLGAVALSSGAYPAPPMAPARSSSSTFIIVAAILLVGLVVGGAVIGTLLYLHSQKPEVAATSPTVTPGRVDAGGLASAAATASGVAPPASVAGAGQAAAARQPAGAAQPSSAASVDPSVSPQPPVAPGGARPKMTGTTAHFSSGRYVGITSKEGRPPLDAAMPRISACHAASELDPPLHDQPSFLIAIAPGGNVTSVQRQPTSSQPAHAKYDACVRSALSSATFPATAKGATITLGVFAPVPR